jgi:hypothetical protein
MACPFRLIREYIDTAAPAPSSFAFVDGGESEEAAEVAVAACDDDDDGEVGALAIADSIKSARPAASASTVHSDKRYAVWLCVRYSACHSKWQE